MITGKSGRLPYPVDVTCNHSKLNDLIPVFNFIVILNEFVFGFSEVSGIDKDIPFHEIREGGNPYPVFARQKSYNSFEQLNFRKGLLIRKGSWSSDAMRTAFSQAAMLPSNIARKAALISAAAADPITSLENGPAYGFLQVFDRQYKEPLVSFSFFSHGASRWDITDLNASSGEFMYETITLVCSDLKRLANSALPSGAWDSNNQEEHKYYEPIDFEEEIVEEMKKNNNEKQSEGKSETDKSIDSKRQEEDVSQLDRKARLEKFIKDQSQIRLKRQKEIEKFEEENAKIKKERQENKEKFEDKDKESVDKLIDEIKQMDPEFTGKSEDGKDMSKADILKKLQELNNAKIKKEHQENKKKFEDKDKESVDKLIEEIKQIYPEFTGKSEDGKDMSKADILKKLQELNNAKVEKEHQENKEKFEKKKQQNSEKDSSKDK